MKLFTQEGKRLWWRTLPKVLVLVAVGFVALSTYFIWDGSKPVSDDRRAEAVAAWEYDTQEHGKWVEDCLATEKQAKEDSGAVDLDYRCNDPEQVPNLNNYLPSNQETFADRWERDTRAMGTTLVFLILAAAASYVAFDFSTGAITSWLTFEPRRTRVFLSKFAVAGVFGALAMVAISALAMLGSFIALSLNGVSTQLPSGEALIVLGVFGRLALAGALYGILGAALAFLIRSTGGVIGIAVAWSLIVDMYLVALLSAGNSRPLHEWTVTRNTQALIDGDVDVYWSVCGPSECVDKSFVISTAHGAIFLVIAVSLVAAVAWLSFRKRDLHG